MRWTLLVEETPHPGWYNMAVDQALLDLSAAHGEGFLRCYRWKPHCLSFGRHEPALRRYDQSRIRQDNIDVVRRPTGGRAVWHAGELTYAVAAPTDVFGSLHSAYRHIHDTVRAALASLGVPATLAAPPARQEGLSSGACFSQPVGGEVMVNGRKVVGSAQIRQRGAFLQHGSILLDDDQAMVAGLTIGQAPASAESPLNSMLPGPVSPARVTEALASAAQAWGDTWSGDIRAAEREETAASHFQRFRSEAWTWRR